MQRAKSRVFVRPIGHIKRNRVHTSAAISHCDEPSFFQKIHRDEQSHYRAEFKLKPNSSVGPRRPASPNRCNKPHPVQVYHLRRLRSGLVCDVRSKIPPEAMEKNVIGVSPLGPSADARSWTKTVYKPFDIRNTLQGAKLHENARRFPAIGIIPTCFSQRKEDHVDCIAKGERDDHWLPGSLKLTTPIALRNMYDYFPRKRKLIVKREDAAGIKSPVDFEHRYHELPRRRGRKPALITIRAGI